MSTGEEEPGETLMSSSHSFAFSSGTSLSIYFVPKAEAKLEGSGKLKTHEGDKPSKN